MISPDKLEKGSKVLTLPDEEIGIIYDFKKFPPIPNLYQVRIKLESGKIINLSNKDLDLISPPEPEPEHKPTERDELYDELRSFFAKEEFHKKLDSILKEI